MQASCDALFGAERVARLLSARSYLQLPKDSAGAVCADELFALVQQRVKIQQNLVFLRFHDARGDGRIVERQLRAFLRELAPTLLSLQGARLCLRVCGGRLLVVCCV